jgi:hypothetical protein
LATAGSSLWTAAVSSSTMAQRQLLHIADRPLPGRRADHHPAQQPRYDRLWIDRVHHRPRGFSHTPIGAPAMRCGATLQLQRLVGIGLSSKYNNQPADSPNQEDYPGSPSSLVKATTRFQAIHLCLCHQSSWSAVPDSFHPRDSLLYC